jgi:hypothetical protein
MELHHHIRCWVEQHLVVCIWAIGGHFKNFI